MLIQKVEILCGEVELMVRDHTASAHASVDARVPQARRSMERDSETSLHV